MDLIMNVKQDKDLQHVVAKGREHLFETFNKDLMSVDELLAYTLDFIDKIEELQDELQELKDKHDGEIEGLQNRSTSNQNYERRG